MAENKALTKELDTVKAEVAAAKVESLFESAEEVTASVSSPPTSPAPPAAPCAGCATPCATRRKSRWRPSWWQRGRKDHHGRLGQQAGPEKGLKAGSLVKTLSAIAGGKGGGKPDFAMAGLKDPNKIDEALHAAADAIAQEMH